MSSTFGWISLRKLPATVFMNNYSVRRWSRLDHEQLLPNPVREGLPTTREMGNDLGYGPLIRGGAAARGLVLVPLRSTPQGSLAPQPAWHGIYAFCVGF